MPLQKYIVLSVMSRHSVRLIYPLTYQGKRMKVTNLVFSMIAGCVLAGNALAMTQAEHSAQKDTIAAQYKTSHEQCKVLSGNAKDICVAEAKGAEKVAKAELEAQYKPSAKNTEKVHMAKADAAYDVAKEKCDDLAGNPKDVCVKEAKAAHVKAKEDAKVAKVKTDASQDKAATVGDAQHDATVKKHEADYKVAKEKCDVLAGDAKDSCINTAKAKYGIN